jgi:hypothetical protein
MKITTDGIVPYFDNAMPQNFDTMATGNIEVIIIRALFKDNVIHKNTMNNLPITLKYIFIKQIFNCDLESSYGYRHEVKNVNKFPEELKQIGLKLPFGCKLYSFKTEMFDGDNIVMKGCKELVE